MGLDEGVSRTSEPFAQNSLLVRRRFVVVVKDSGDSCLNNTYVGLKPSVG